jgi:hypothetical protein
MSIEKGPIADSNPNISMRKNLLLPFMQLKGGKTMPDKFILLCPENSPFTYWS